jgi:hypothetical protein
MTIQYSTTHRTNNVTDIVTQLSTTGYLLIYSGSAPANCGTAASGTLLASLPLSSTAGTVASGVLTLNAITSAAAAATGTAGYWRLCTSSAGTTVVAQGTVGTSGADLNFAGGVSFTSGETISITSFTITANGA